MSAYTDDEQLEQLKKWWNEYGTAIIVGVVIALILGFGYRFWQKRHEVKLAHVSMRYEQLLTSVVNGDPGAVEGLANLLIKRYPNTPYTQLAALQLARQDVYQNNLGDAEDKLLWVMKHADNNALSEVARIRAARVFLADNQAQKALDLLNKSDDKIYEPIALEVKGDILVKMGKLDEARTAYQSALSSLPEFAVMQPLLQMKLNDLATKIPTGASQ